MNFGRKSFLIVITAIVFGGGVAAPRVGAQWLRDGMLWSPDSTRLAAQIENGALIIEDGKVISRCFMEGTVTALSFTPDSASVYLGSSDGRLIVCDATRGRQPGKPELSLPRPETINHIAFNADGSRFLVSTGTQSPEGLYLYDADMALMGQYDPFGFFQPPPFFLPDSSVLTFSRDDNVLSVMQDGAPLSQITFTGNADDMRITPDGHYLIAHMIDEGVGVFDLTTGEQLRTFAEATHAWSPVNDYAYIYTPTHLLIANIVTGEGVIQFASTAQPLFFPSYSGNALLLQEADSPSSTLFQYGTRTSTPIAIDTRLYGYFSFFVDENMLLFGMGGINTDVASIELDSEAVTTQSITQSPLFSPLAAGEHAFALFSPQTMMVFDINTGEILHQRDIEEFSVTGFAPSPDGQAYAARGENMVLIQALDGAESLIALP